MDSGTKERLHSVFSRIKKIYSSEKKRDNMFSDNFPDDLPKEVPKIEDSSDYNLDRVAKPEESLEWTASSDSETNRFSFPVQLENPKLIKDFTRDKIRNISETYSIVVSNYKNKKINISKAHISYDKETNSLKYDLIEPKLENEDKQIVKDTLEQLKDLLDINLTKLKSKEGVYDYLDAKVTDIWKTINFSPSEIQEIRIKYYIFRDTIGYDKIDALMQDPNIEDISCDGINLPIYIFHRNPMFGEIPTNIKFETAQELDSFVMKLSQKCNRTVSIAAPLMDGSLSDGSRVQITYGKDIARRGSNFTIRKFFKIPLTPIDLINLNTLDPMMLAYLWLSIENQNSVLIAGSTATGKTTLLNALSLFIEPNLKIVSIEDTAELQLPHINWMPQVARTGFGPKKYGEISLYDLLKATLRQRPDYLIVGEVRGAEASVLFQAMSTGHPGLSTLHADSVNAVIDRLTNKPINLPLTLLQNLDIIIFITRVKKENKITRRVEKIIEVEGYDSQTGSLKTNEVFVWNSSKDEFISRKSSLSNKIAQRYGWSEQEVSDELLRRMHLLIWMLNSGLYHFTDVSKIIKMYYTNPEKLYQIMSHG